MIKYKKVMKEQEVYDSVICDKCKTEFYYNEQKDELETQEFCYIRFIGGYNSVFGDGNEVKIDLCQHCLKELIGDLIE